MELKINLTSKEQKDLEGYCKLNNFVVEDIAKKSLLEGFRIEKYGLLSGGSNVVEKEVIKEVVKYVEIEKPVEKIIEKEVPVEKIVEKEVIKEVPFEKIVEKEVVKEVIKEIPVERVVVQEVIKEIPVEKIVTKTEYITDDNKVKELVRKIEELENAPSKIVEVIKEVPVDKVVIQEKIVELIKEVPVEKIVEVKVENETDKDLKSKFDSLQTTIQKLKQDNIDKDTQIKDLENKLSNIQNVQEEKKAIFLKGSNLNDTLYGKL